MTIIRWNNVAQSDATGEVLSELRKSSDNITKGVRGLGAFAGDMYAKQEAEELGKAKEALYAATDTLDKYSKFDFTKFADAQNTSAANRAALFAEANKRHNTLLAEESNKLQLEQTRLATKLEQDTYGAKVEAAKLGVIKGKQDIEQGKVNIEQGKVRLASDKLNLEAQRVKHKEIEDLRQTDKNAYEFVTSVSLKPGTTPEDMLVAIKQQAETIKNPVLAKQFTTSATAYLTELQQLPPEAKDELKRVTEGIAYATQTNAQILYDPATMHIDKETGIVTGTPLINTATKEPLKRSGLDVDTHMERLKIAIAAKDALDATYTTNATTKVDITKFAEATYKDEAEKVVTFANNLATDESFVGPLRTKLRDKYIELQGGLPATATPKQINTMNEDANTAVNRAIRKLKDPTTQRFAMQATPVQLGFNIDPNSNFGIKLESDPQWVPELYRQNAEELLLYGLEVEIHAANAKMGMPAIQAQKASLDYTTQLNQQIATNNIFMANRAATAKALEELNKKPSK